MTYKWTLEYIDSITWPTIKDLLGAIKEYPPADLVIPAFLKGSAAPQEIGKVPSKMTNVKKGKLKGMR